MVSRTITMSVAAFVAILATVPASAAPQSFPETLIGSWCETENVYGRLDIKGDEFEEGDSLCKHLATKAVKGNGVTVFLSKLNCDPGVEGQKSKVIEERYSAFAIGAAKFIIREGGYYARDIRVLYGRCKD